MRNQNVVVSPPSDGRLTYTCDELADALGISRSQVWKMLSRGQLPDPIRFGRSVRWLRAEIDEWLRRGHPPRDRWNDMKGEWPGGSPFGKGGGR